MRLARAKVFTQEREWYADTKENVLGVVLLDKVDNDWSYVVLGRDEVARFRAIDQETSHRTVDEARAALDKKMMEYVITGESVYPQGLEKKNQKTFRIFQPIVPREKLHPDFIQLSESHEYSSAREIIKEIAYTFEDVDGNYIQQFQTTGFEARLWELYLYAVLHELDFDIDRTCHAPDYACIKERPLFIEATTTNVVEKQARALTGKPLEDYIAIRFGSALFSKVQKRYWEKLPRSPFGYYPFVLALADVRKLAGATFSASCLQQYLYGRRQIRVGKQVRDQSIKEHTWQEKTIPSGFFYQRDVKNISAILLSDGGTISKFNRMGKLAGFGDQSVLMGVEGERYETANSQVRKSYRMFVEHPKYEEKWSDGMRIFHNPYALASLKMQLFPRAEHIRLYKGEIVTRRSGAFTLWSETRVFKTKREANDFTLG
jgi:hypothetical protein